MSDNNIHLIKGHGYLAGYTWNADVYCVDCTIKKFGAESLNDGTARDFEDNEPHAFNVFTESDYKQHCGDCGDEIDNSWLHLDCPKCGRNYVRRARFSETICADCEEKEDKSNG